MIKLVNLHKRFGDQKVLDGLSLEIPRGKITVILGSSGEGKSVLLKHILGLLAPDEGQVFVDGKECWKLKGQAVNQARKRFGMLFQGAALFDSLTVAQNVAFPLIEHTEKNQTEVMAIVRKKLSLVGLEGIEHKMPSELSGGMRKRVGLARALALEPEIILYDEPTTGLDPLMTVSINKLIVETQKKLLITSIIISHDIESTFQVADKVAMLHSGKILVEGTPETLKQSSDPFVRAFLGVGA